MDCTSSQGMQHLRWTENSSQCRQIVQTTAWRGNPACSVDQQTSPIVPKFRTQQLAQQQWYKSTEYNIWTIQANYNRSPTNGTSWYLNMPRRFTPSWRLVLENCLSQSPTHGESRPMKQFLHLDQCRHSEVKSISAFHTVQPKRKKQNLCISLTLFLS